MHNSSDRHNHLKSFIKKNYIGDYYKKCELPNIVCTYITHSQKPSDKKIDNITVITLMVQHIFYSKKYKKYYFSLTKTKKIKMDKMIDMLVTNVNEVLNDSSLINNDESDSEINSDDLEQLESDFFDSYDQNIRPPYSFPTNSPFTPKQYRQDIHANTYGPYGTQWVHDVQVDDIYDDVLEKRAKQYDALRAIVLPEQRSPEWFQMRTGKITASDGGTVLGLNKYEPQYKFILKKTIGSTFKSNKFCYHGKKFEEPATMIYAYRMNVTVEEFGLMGHPTINFLGASPDGICNRFKYNGINQSKFVGRMLEIKCPLSRQIKMEGPIKDHICPIYYWIQVQLQLECCDLEECDFWQCKISEYKNRNEFIEDTDPSEPFRSTFSGFEKGCLIQLLPKNKINDTINGKYWSVVHEDAIFIYPDQIEMTPYDCDMWISQTINSLRSIPTYFNYVFDKVVYWRLEESKNVVIKRDRAWFAENLPTFKRMWDYVLFLRNHKDKLDLFVQYVETRKIKRNNNIMKVVDRICGPEHPKYQQFLDNICSSIDNVSSTSPLIVSTNNNNNNNNNSSTSDHSIYSSTYMF